MLQRCIQVNSSKAAHHNELLLPWAISADVLILSNSGAHFPACVDYADRGCVLCASLYQPSLASPCQMAASVDHKQTFFSRVVTKIALGLAGCIHTTQHDTD